MQFLAPGLLWALAALAIPILLHLFYFRRFRKVEFSNVRFLKEVKDETQNRSRLRNLLVLALRLLAFAALVLAFAQPFLPTGDAPQADRLKASIYVDNSFSMSAQSSDVALLDKAKQRAREIVRSFGETAEFQIITNELDGTSGRLLSEEDALARLDDIGIGPEAPSGATVLARMARVDRPESPTQGFLLSDFQASQFAIDRLADTLLDVSLVPITAVVQQNISLDSIWMSSPLAIAGEPVVLLAKLTNHGNTDAEAVRLSVRANGRQQPFGTKSVPAASTVVDTLRLSNLRPGWVDAAVEITDFPLEFDDTYNVSFLVRDRLRALAISEGSTNRYLQAALPAGGALGLTTERADALNYSALGSYDLIVLDDLIRLSSGLVSELNKYVSDGGKLLVFPSKAAEVSSYNAMFSELNVPRLGAYAEGAVETSRVNTNSFVFSDVYERLPSNLRLPKATGRFSFLSRTAERLLTFRDGAASLLASPSGQGIVYVSATPLGATESDLARNGEIFVPMLYRMALSGGTSRPLAFTIGQRAAAQFPLPERLTESALSLSGTSGSFIPVQRRLGSRLLLSFGEDPREAGFFRLRTPEDSVLAHVAFNYDRTESPQQFLSETELASTGQQLYDGNESGSLSAALQRSVRGDQWWPYCLLAAFLALLLEALILRFWQPTSPAAKRASMGRKSSLA